MKQPSDEFLAHYGVVGMKWGKRSSGDSGSSKPSKAPKDAKPTTQDIKLARARQSARADVSDGHLNDLLLATTDKGRAKAEKLFAASEDLYVNNPDFKLSAKKTKGEKVAVGLGYGAVALSALALAVR